MTTESPIGVHNNTVRIMSACLNVTALDWQRNKELILEAIQIAKNEAASLLVLPEMAISGYGCDDAFLHRMVTDRAAQTLESLLPSSRDLVVLVGLPIHFQDCVYNCIAVIANGKLLGIRPKKKLANSGVHYESRWFKPWPDKAVSTITINGEEVPFGDLVFAINGKVIGIELCEEAWTAGRELEQASRRGVHILCNPSASHFALGKVDSRVTLVRQGSLNGNMVYVYSNLLGCDAGRLIYDGQAYIASKGTIVAKSSRLSMRSVGYCLACVDIADATSAKAELVHFKPNGKMDAGLVVASDFTWPHQIAPMPTESTEPNFWETLHHRDFEEFTRALALGFLDYIEKSRSKGVVVSLSGGRDSASVICLATIGLYLILSEAGLQGIKKRFPWLVECLDVASQADHWIIAKTLARRFTTTVYQSTKNSSKVTETAAKEIAAAVGTTHYSIAVDALVGEVHSLVKDTLGVALDPFKPEHDVACQNIQARARSQFAWVLANLEGKLLVPPSNRSEAAEGYCTMDGDTAGGFNPIGSVAKSFLSEWLFWLEHQGIGGVVSISELAAINSQEPTAELQPQELAQTDERDLGPYEVRDFVEQAFVSYRRTPEEVRLLVVQQFGDRYTPDQLSAWVGKYLHNFSINQWKRERLAPSLFVEAPNLDPRSWCRWPILSGGIESL